VNNITGKKELESHKKEKTVDEAAKRCVWLKIYRIGGRCVRRKGWE